MSVFGKIGEFFDFIWDIITTIVEYIIQFFEFVATIPETISSVLELVNSFVPLEIVAVITVLLTVSLLYKIFGRE